MMTNSGIRICGMATLQSRQVWLICCLLMLTLAGCRGVSTEPNQQAASNALPPSYTGPAAVSNDVRAFQTQVWDNLKANNRCGSCHIEGGQTPGFVRQDDINAAYNQALTVVNRTTPADSRLVTKVAAGHNCWLSSSSACADVITAYLESWLGSTGSDTRQIELTPPPIRDAGASKSFPAAPGAFTTTVWPLLTQYCAACHTDSVSKPQAPYFAHGDVNIAYDAVSSTHKIDLDNPANSRLVLRLRNEFHNCWSDCQANADELQAAITAYATGVNITPIDPRLVLSKAIGLGDGIIASGGSRHDANVIALYEFKTGSGNTLYDTSGVEPALNLTLSGSEGVNYQWVGGWGIEFNSGKAQGSTSSSRKLASRIKTSGEYSIEAWVVPGNVTQEGPARIISYSAGTTLRNFTLGQTLYTYNFLHRSTSTDGNGEPRLSTADADEDLQASQQHVVITFDPVNGRRIYVNGASTGDVDATSPGNLSDWDDSYAFVLGNEVSSDRPWNGKLRLVAVHDRALTADQVRMNFEAGVGEKYYLLFSVSHLIDVPESYVLFQVSQFDNYSYLFYKPTFISLDENAQPASISFAGLRLGINGRETAVGQAYSRLDGTLNASGQVLSPLGTIIALEKGVQNDEFFLTFERLGSHSNVVVEAAPLQPAPPANGDPVPDIGLRTFEEINATMAAVTGVSSTLADVRNTYTTVRQQLPTVENIEGFLSAHQVAISQLAIEYCNALVEDASLRTAYFPGFDFSAAAGTAFNNTTKRNQVINPLMSRMLGNSLLSQPDTLEVSGELNALIDRLTTCGGSCATGRTGTVVKAVCAATLGNGAILIQ